MYFYTFFTRSGLLSLVGGGGGGGGAVAPVAPPLATGLHCRTGQKKKNGLKVERQNGQTKLYFISGIINPLFDGLTNNTRAHFAHCKMRHCVLYVKPSNKVYFLTNSSYSFMATVC